MGTLMDLIDIFQTGSTNDDAKALADAGALAFTVVTARVQTAGRGRYQRQWISSEGNVFWSIILRPDRTWHVFSDIVYINALAIRDVLLTLCGHRIDLKFKWPNDLMVDGRKVGGSLLESGGMWNEGRPAWVVIGTGINLVSHPDSPDMRYTASDLSAAGFPYVTRDDVVHRLGPALKEQIERWKQFGFAEIRKTYLQSAFRLGDTIHVGLTGDRTAYREGIYKGIDDSGHLIMDTPDGVIRLSSAEVVLRQSSAL